MQVISDIRKDTSSKAFTAKMAVPTLRSWCGVGQIRTDRSLSRASFRFLSRSEDCDDRAHLERMWGWIAGELATLMEVLIETGRVG